MSAQVLERPHVHTHECGHAAGVTTDDPTAERTDCNMPCQATPECGGVCMKAWGHPDPHNCNQDALHSWGP